MLVIDDGSTDLTASLAEAAGAKVVRLPFNLGIGGAVQTGYLYAQEHGYDVAVQIDGDGQHDPRYVYELCVDFARIPARHGHRLALPRSRERRPSLVGDAPRRHHALRASRLDDHAQRVTDPTSGLRMTNRAGIELFARDYPRDYPEVEAVLMMHAHRLRSCEVPVLMRPRRSGVSAISSTQPFYYMVKVLLAVLVGPRRARPNAEDET